MSINIANSGQSPARNVKIHVVSEYFIRETMGDETTELMPYECEGECILVRPITANGKEEVTHSTPEMSKEVRRHFDGHYGIDLEVTGKVFWTDVFDKTDEIDFSFGLVSVLIYDLRKVLPGGETDWQSKKMVPGPLPT